MHISTSDQKRIRLESELNSINLHLNFVCKNIDIAGLEAPFKDNITLKRKKSSFSNPFTFFTKDFFTDKFIPYSLVSLAFIHVIVLIITE